MSTGSAVAEGSAAAPARRVLVICTDQQRWDSLGCYGSEEVHTPHIDSLAADGTLFERCYATNPVCAPSRASMLTGTYPYQHGLWANGVKLPADRVTLLRNLAAAGYRSGLVGKLHLSPCAGGRTEDPAEYGFGWHRWSHGPPQAAPTNAYHGWLAERHPELATEAAAAATHWGARTDLPPAGGRPRAHHDMPAEAHYSRWAAEAAMEFIDSMTPRQPWLLWVNFFDPHHPFAAPEEYVRRVSGRRRRPPVGSADDLRGRPRPLRGLSEQSYAGSARGFQEYRPEEISQIRDRYWAMIDLVDEQAGRILRAAEEAGPTGELLVLFISDHGEMLGDHGLLLKGPMMYEGAVRVPCILRWPGRVPSGRRVGGPVSLADVAATISQAAGIEAPAGGQGQSLVGVAAGTAEPREAVITEYRNSGHPHDPPISTTMVSDGQYKAIVWHGQHGHGAEPAGELYDLRSDPGELVNLWRDPRLAQIRARLLLAMATELSFPSAAWPARDAFF
ncbi:MAG TPA: sulfatase-like hydrolase/transferase [Streptosporangiaceae bacterium]|jgi:arylsulfatase A-like enzyme